MYDILDPRLLRHLDGLKDDEVANAVIVFQFDNAQVNAETAAKAMLDQATEIIGVTPVSVRLLPKLGAMHVSASGIFLKQLLVDMRVSAASLGTDDE
ncbi:MAG: hypothetical protein PSV46_07455 [Reyranella sp.]|nr:hypothetical protein [Reyranella sp.]